MRRATLLLIAVCATSLGTASIVGGIALLRSSAQTLSQSRDKLQDLADAIGGQVACSRPVADKGWMDRARQVEDASATRKSQLDQELDAAGAQ